MPKKETVKPPAGEAPPPPSETQATNGKTAAHATFGTATPGSAAPQPAGTTTPISGGTALGHAVWLMMNMPNYRHVFLSDLEWMVLPAIILNQYRLFNADNKVVAFAAWAYLSEAVEKRLQEADPRLAPVEWKSGDRLWLIDLFAPFGHTDAALAELRQSAFAGKSFKMHKRNPDGTRVVMEVGASERSIGPPNE